MRKLLCAFGLTSALVFALAAHAAAPNFAGTWTLDKSKSQGLSQRIQNAESVSWVITQTDKEITIEEKVTGGGGPGGRRRWCRSGWCSSRRCSSCRWCSSGWSGRWSVVGGMGGMMGGPRTYNLDGSETTGDTGRGKFARKATMSSDGKTLELVQKTTFQDQDGTRSRRTRVTSLRFQPTARC